VMRGEEVQVLGAILAGVGMSAASPESQKIVLPGTHSKWVSVVDRQIADLRTFMTGEVYAALKDHTILGRLMDGERPHADGFAQGVRAAAERGGPGWLLSALFSVRSLPLFDRLPTDALADYLSGLLIGSEIMEGAGPGQSFTVLAGDALLSRYTDAACILGCMAIPLASDCIVQGYLAIAQARGLVEAGKATEQRPKIGHNECGGAL
jgi:2-dehydro-3-deoxygalactonokinase